MLRQIVELDQLNDIYLNNIEYSIIICENIEKYVFVCKVSYQNNSNDHLVTI